MSSPIQDPKIIQIGFIVRDLEATKQQVARFLDVPVPPTVPSGEYEVTQTVYRGEPGPLAQCHMAFFDFGGLQVEFIEPNEAPSVWRDHLRRHGEGVHHIAFGVKGINKAIERCEQWGMTLEQKGEYRRGNGRYAYLNALEDLKIFVELLESDE